MPWSRQELELLESIAGTMPTSEIAKLLNKTPSAVSQCASRQQISLNYYGFGREIIIDESTVDEIKRLLSLGYISSREIARRTNVKESYVAGIKAERFRCGKKKTPKRNVSHKHLIGSLNTVFC
ncbi:hypothetical protein [Vibrio scophthalmi]|uniref:Uncharacterized protein n=1 Tax=Vibrio scophthalmi TaxID=45658 RepID=A0A1E3WHA7_9VIBR|nr:hypothetical protein [Vibrio scophthalmi]ODS05160.1 hypothetical protein VSF3289_04301 [Vibrio scophthalmi]